MAKLKAPEARTGNDWRPAPSAPLPENVLQRYIPPAPAKLGDAGKALWQALWEAGGDAYSPKTDIYIIERYCRFHERRIELSDLIDEEGWISSGSKGQTILHPAARALADVESKMLALEDRLGLSPESRLRLGTAAIEHKSKLDELMDGPEEYGDLY